MCKKSAYIFSFVLTLSLAVHSTFGELVAYYPMYEGAGTVVRDFSGYRHVGIAQAEPVWIDSAPGFGNALYFDGSEPQPAWVNCGTWNPSEQTGELSVACWVRWDGYTGDWHGIVAKRDDWDPAPYGSLMWYLEVNATNGYLLFGSRSGYIGVMDALPEGQWKHVAAAFNGTTARLYVDGEQMSDGSFTFGSNTNATVIIGADNLGGGNGFYGAIDEVRIYDTALTQDEIQIDMFEVSTNPELAFSPNPKNNTAEVTRDMILQWKPGLYAATHDVYFGTDYNDVNEAIISDPRGVLVSQSQDTTAFDPLGTNLLEFGKTYYWRIDEINDLDPNSPWKGNVWSFTTANFLLVDDFENYNDIDNKIYDTWSDYYVNNTGMTVGYIEPPSVEKVIIHLGKQSMPLQYDNDGIINEGTELETSGTLFYSEVERPWNDAQDWTQDDVESLTIWFRGHPAQLSSFIEESAGTFKVKGIGEDIWDSSDQLYYAYKQVNGACKIIAKVDSLENSDPFAKAGIMIRDTLDSNARYCALLITPENGVRYQYRSTEDDVTERQFDPNVAAPYWVRLERTSGGLVRAYYSENDSDWKSFSLMQISMSNPLYVGLAVSSHNKDVPCEAVFSNVSFPDTTVSPEWTSQDIGLLTNDVEPMYVVLNGNVVVYHDDPNAALIDQWTQWNIPLHRFAERGVNLSNINSLGIGLGNRDNPQLGGKGIIYIDDIRLYRPPVQ